MTLIQNEYWKRKESERSNRANEDIKRSEIAETRRHNVSSETETSRHNVATEGETNRHNLATEGETNRSNLASEAIRRAETNSKVLLNAANANKANKEAALVDKKIVQTDLSNQNDALVLNRTKEVYSSANNELAGTLEPIRQGVEIVGSALGAVASGTKAIGNLKGSTKNYTTNNNDYSTRSYNSTSYNY